MATTTYWLTFRIDEHTINGKSYNERYTALYAAIQTRATRWWLDPTSFIAFESDSSIDQLCTALKGALAASHDMFLLREIDRKEARLFGKQKDPDIKILMPYLMAA